MTRLHRRFRSLSMTEAVDFKTNLEIFLAVILPVP